MKRLALLIVYLFISALAQGAVSLTVTPSEVRPGTQVEVSGDSLPADLRINLGDTQILPDLEAPGLLVFTAPLLPPGDYLLVLKAGDTPYGPPAVLKIIEPTPQIVSIAPTNIDECTSPDSTTIAIETRNFLNGGSLLLDGKTVAYEKDDSNRLTFHPPPLPAGTYGVQLTNPKGALSLPHTLWVNNIPEIYNVTIGNDYVSHYEIVVDGKNFLYGSQIVVSEYPVGFSDRAPNQRAIPLEGSFGPRGSELELSKKMGGRENMRYVDCRTLIYNRHPYSSQPKDLILQVVNPDGKISSPYTASLP